MTGNTFTPAQTVGMRQAMERIAAQKLPEELEAESGDHEGFGPDYEHGYEQIVKIAREALAAQPPAAPVEMNQSVYEAIIAGIGAADVAIEQAGEIVAALGRNGYTITPFDRPRSSAATEGEKSARDYEHGYSDGIEWAMTKSDLSEENRKLRERLGPQGLEVVFIGDVGHYVNEKVKAEIDRLRAVPQGARK